MVARTARRWLWVVVAAAMVAGVAWLLQPAPVPVTTARVDRGRVQETIDEDGETRVRNRFVVSAPVTGRLRRIALREGDRVAEGQVVAIIEPAPLDTRARQQAAARLEAAMDAERVVRARHESAKVALEQAERDRDRAANLSARGLVADEVKEHAELAVSAARKDFDALAFQVKAAAHEVEEARAAIAPRPNGAGATSVTSPVAGRVLRRAEESERVVLAGAEVMEIGDVHALDIVVDLLSTDAVNVAPGDTLEVRDWGRDSTLVAILQRVEPSGFTKISALGVEEQRVNVVALLPDPPPALGDRFRVGVRVVLWRADGILRAPRGALFQAGKEWAAFVVEGSRVRERRVGVGHRGDEYVEITGLDEGATVVLYPDERVRDGVRVAVSRSR